MPVNTTPAAGGVQPVGGPQQTPATLGAALVAAAKRWGVPQSILTGVFGMETNYGADVATSSTGAMGLMQFEPATAAAYGYPMTNSPSLGQAQQQFDAAAHYLANLYQQNGHNWDTALQHYSGGGYGLAQVQQKAKAAPNPGGTSSWVAGATPSIPNPLSGLSGIWASIVGDAKYAGVMVGVLLLGALMIFHAFSGGGSQTRVVVAP